MAIEPLGHLIGGKDWTGFVGSPLTGFTVLGKGVVLNTAVEK